MKFLEFVTKSDFKRYYFVLHSSRIPNHSILHLNFTTNDCNFPKGSDLDICLVKEDTEVSYDLGKCVPFAATANSVAKMCDLSKAFEFDYLEHQDNTCWIHLLLKDINSIITN